MSEAASDDYNPTDNELRAIIAKALPDEGADLARLVLREREDFRLLREVLTHTQDQRQGYHRERDQARAALTRVEALLDERRSSPFSEPISEDEIRAAITGDDR